MRIRGTFCTASILTASTLAILVLAGASFAASVSDFAPYSFVESGNVLLPGRLHIPADYTTEPGIARPLIIFLHGAGESGTNNLAQINGNIDNLLAAAKDRAAFLYAPQTNAGWSNTTILARAMQMVDRAITEFNADPTRIYLTGLSMGGAGTWNFLSQFPDRVAASAPIAAAGPSFSFNPENILHEPIWAFHGRFDATVPATVTRDVVDNLATLAGLPTPSYPPLNTFGPHLQFDFPPLDLHYTDMRGGHGIWPEVYNTPDLYEWMFARRTVPEPGAIGLALIGLLAGGIQRHKRS